jgi:AGZA family xanthine/uracil permease-like MFS transporter
MTPTVELFVNGTLMRGDVLHGNLEGARFCGERRTAPRYRVYSIGDVHPGMIPVDKPREGVSVAGEVYELELEHLERLLAEEPAGLGLGVVELEDGERRLGIFWTDRTLPETATDISRYKGWRAYRTATTKQREQVLR